YLGVLQVAGNLRPRHGHILDARIAQLEQYRLTGHLADGFGNPGQSMNFHMRSQHLLARRALGIPFQTSSSWSINSATGWLRKASTICCNVFRTWLASLPTIAKPRIAICRLSWASPSATETLNRCFSLSLMLLITCRLSLSVRDSRSNRRTRREPTVISSGLVIGD